SITTVLSPFANAASPVANADTSGNPLLPSRAGVRSWRTDTGPSPANARPPRADAGPPRADAPPPRADAPPPRADAPPPRADAPPPRADARPSRAKQGAFSSRTRALFVGARVVSCRAALLGQSSAAFRHKHRGHCSAPGCWVSRGFTRCAPARRPLWMTARRSIRAQTLWPDLSKRARSVGRCPTTDTDPDAVSNRGGRMNAQLRRRLEMAVRVRDFLRAHQMDGVGEGLGLAKLEELLERAENLATQQRTGVAVVRSATKQRQEIRRGLQPKILGYLSVVGAVAASRNAELAEQFQMPPSNATHQALLTMGRAIL